MELTDLLAKTAGMPAPDPSWMTTAARQMGERVFDIGRPADALTAFLARQERFVDELGRSFLSTFDRSPLLTPRMSALGLVPEEG